MWIEKAKVIQRDKKVKKQQSLSAAITTNSAYILWRKLNLMVTICSLEQESVGVPRAIAMMMIMTNDFSTCCCTCSLISSPLLTILSLLLYFYSRKSHFWSLNYYTLGVFFPCFSIVQISCLIQPKSIHTGCFLRVFERDGGKRV